MHVDFRALHVVRRIALHLYGFIPTAEQLFLREDEVCYPDAITSSQYRSYLDTPIAHPTYWRNNAEGSTFFRIFVLYIIM